MSDLAQAGVEAIYPLTSMQEGILFDILNAPEQALYEVTVNAELDNPLRADLLEQAWRRVVGSHQALRTSFYWERRGRPLQIVHQAADLELLRRPVDKMESTTDAVDGPPALSLTKPPLMRLVLACDEERALGFRWTFHHLVLDGWSVSVVLQDVLAAYAALRRGSSILGPRGPQFEQFVRWFNDQPLDGPESYWRENLAGAAPTDLVSSLPRSSTTKRGSGSVLLTLPIGEDVKRWARAWGVTLASLIDAAWGITLGTYGNSKDVVFGTTMSVRPPQLVGIARTVGLLINTLPFRVRLEGDQTAGQLVRSIHAQRSHLRRVGHTPLSKIPLWLGLQESRSLFDSIAVTENYPSVEMLGEVAGLGYRSLVFSERSRYFQFSATPRDGSIDLGLCYPRAEIDRAVAQEVLTTARAVLEGIVSDPNRPVARIPRLDAGAQQRLIDLNTTTPFPPEPCVHELVAAQAVTRPEAVALRCGAVTLTYRELNERASQLARHLRHLGAGPEIIVGLCLERSVEMVVGLLGILKAGAAYLPLDPSYPRERLQFMLTDAQSRILVSQQHLLPLLPATGLQIVCLDRDASEISRCPMGDLTNLVSGDNLAYVVYTSGSTGQPKGVLIPHRNITRLFAATDRWFQFGGTDVWSVFHSISFDFSVWEIWGALVHGGVAVVVPMETARDPGAFAQLLSREQVTILSQTPGAFRELVSELTNQSLELAIRTVVFGGERINLEAVGRWITCMDGHAELINMYGITETTVHVTYRKLNTSDVARGGSPIGWAIPDLQLYVLNESLEPVPPLAIGELYVGGAGLARGYLGRPALTAERFVPSPFGRAGERLYKTGDLARWSGRNEVEYIGRNDSQVKLHGYRIELSEIEFAIGLHPAVAQAIVFLQLIDAARTRLVAYVATKPAASGLTYEDLRGFLIKRLPQHMIPSRLVVVDSFPLTAQGKVDRIRLPAPTDDAPATTPSAANTLAGLLATIWSDVLGTSVTPSDNFFALGGDSISAIEVVAIARKHSIALSIPTLLRYPRLDDLARALQHGNGE